MYHIGKVSCIATVHFKSLVSISSEATVMYPSHGRCVRGHDGDALEIFLRIELISTFLILNGPSVE